MSPGDEAFIAIGFIVLIALFAVGVLFEERDDGEKR